MSTGNGWTSEPGLLDLIEQGASLDDLRRSEFTNSLAIRSDLGAGMFDNLVNWLRGYRRDRNLFERQPAWMPLAELWPPPGGTANFKYTSSDTVEGAAELSVFASKLGSSSKTLLGDAIQTPTSGQPHQLCVRVFLTGWRYVSLSDGQPFDRIDVNCEGALKETDTRPAPTEGFAEASLALSLNELLARGYDRVDGPHRIADLSGNGTSTKEFEGQSTNEWGCEFGLPALDLIQSNIKLRAKTVRSTAFKATFQLPVGHEYVFVQRKGERPIVPLCYRLRETL